MAWWGSVASLQPKGRGTTTTPLHTPTCKETFEQHKDPVLFNFQDFKVTQSCPERSHGFRERSVCHSTIFVIKMTVLMDWLRAWNHPTSPSCNYTVLPLPHTHLCRLLLPFSTCVGEDYIWHYKITLLHPSPFSCPFSATLLMSTCWDRKFTSFYAKGP